MQLANLIIILSLAPAIAVCAQPPAALPSTQPATPDPSRFIVTILPVQVAGNGMPAWIGRSVQQSLQAEVAASGYALYDKSSPNQAARPPGIDPGVVVDVICRGTGSDLSIQVSVVDLTAQWPIRHIRIDGNARDFLTLKDQARAQFHQILDQRRDAMQAAITPLITQATPPVQPLPPGQRPANPNALPPGSKFDSSALSQSMDHPAQFEQQYRALYDQRPLDGGYGRFGYYPPAYIGYPSIYPYGFYGPGYTIIRRSPQYFPQIGFGFGFGYGNNHLQVNVQGGVGQNNTTGSTTILGGP